MKSKFLVRVLKAFLYPPKCLACGSIFRTESNRQEIPNPAINNDVNRKSLAYFLFQQTASNFLCPSCNSGCTPIEPPFCTTCGTMLPSCDSDSHTCGACINNPPYFNTARAAGIYEKALMALIHSLKYKKDIQVARPLGDILFNSLIRFFSDKEIDVAVPVPLHPIKFRARGFNQSYLLMRPWPSMAASAHPALSNVNIKKNIIVRVKDTEPQTGLNKKQRTSNIKDAFYLKKPSHVSGKRILVVDDVMTTGATVNECAKTLKKVGAEEIHVLTLARTHHE